MEKKEHHSLLEKGDNSWCHFRPTDDWDRSHTPGVSGELETLLGTGVKGRVHVEKTKTERTHSKIRLQVRIRSLNVYVQQ